MKHTLTITIAALLVYSAAGFATQQTTTGFTNPESAVWDAQANAWYVSNMPDGPTAQKGTGFLAKLNAKGAVEQLQWVKGLNAPKGLALSQGQIFVADVDHVAVVDINTATVKTRHKVPGAKFLNDVASAPNGDIYVSDMMANRIHVLPKGGAPQVLLQNDLLEGPNGLLVDGTNLIVATWGVITDPATFGTKTLGKLVRVDLKTKAIMNITPKPLGNLDGIVKHGKAFFVTDWVAGKLLRITVDGKSTVVRDGMKNSADLGLDPARALLAIPQMGGGSVVFVTVK